MGFEEMRREKVGRINRRRRIQRRRAEEERRARWAATQELLHWKKKLAFPANLYSVITQLPNK